MLHQIGVGALGPVFRTYEPTRDRLVAVKVFRLDITPEQAQALADELSVAADAGLFHPSVVEPIAAGVEGTVAYRAEEYVAAETLDVALRHYAPAPIDKVLPLITQLAGAIDFARTAGIGHGALHPRDIFVTTDEARATGFGVVEALERVGLRAPVRRPYSAPERVAGDEWGAPADVFSLAAIAYELLTGRRPAGTGAQIGAVTGSTAGHHPGALHAVFVHAMEEDPSRRFPSALAFASALDAAARGKSPAVAAEGAAAAGAAGLAATALPADFEEPQAIEEPDGDDVVAERDEDVALAALLRAEETAAARAEIENAHDHTLFDDEGVEDLALEVPETERFADEFAVASEGLAARDLQRETSEEDDQQEEEQDDDIHDDRAPVYGAPVRGRDAALETESAGVYVPDVPPRPLFHDRVRASILPVLLALLVGFAGGYAVRTPAPASVPGATPTSDPAATPAGEAARPYSEETVVPAQPPAEAPAVGGDAPPAATSAARPEAEDRATAGRLIVRSTPAGANVTIDGRWRGRTPLTLDELPFGSHDIRVVLSGYSVATEDVALSAGTPARTLSFRLQRSAPAAKPAPTPRAPPPPRSQPSTPRTYTGSIYVDSRPRGATVLVDGKSMGTTPVRIPDVAIGSHVVKLQLVDHADWTTSVRVVSGEDARVTGSLERIR